MKVEIYRPYEIDESSLEYAVIVARYKEKFLMCRHKRRQTWEVPGGKRTGGEAICHTAKRELFEETGAISAEIHKIACYSVSENDVKSYGALFFADVKQLDTIPYYSEIAETKEFDFLPEELTYPNIQPVLFNVAQDWLNTQSSADELWDVLDENRATTGRLHKRGDFMKDGDYHLVVHVWIQNNDGYFLLTKRSPNKGYPNTWETPGGSAISGDNSLSAALREVKEETGLTLLPDNGKCVYTYRGDSFFADIWVFKQDFDLSKITLQEGENCDKALATPEKIFELNNKKLLFPYVYLDKIF